MAEIIDEINAYFSKCTQNELIAWSINGLGFLLIVVGTVLFFLL